MNVKALQELISLYKGKDPRALFVLMRRPVTAPILFLKYGYKGGSQRQKDRERINSMWKDKTAQDVLNVLMKVDQRDYNSETLLTDDELDLLIVNLLTIIHNIPDNALHIRLKYLELPPKIENAILGYSVEPGCIDVSYLNSLYSSGKITRIAGIGDKAITEIKSVLQLIEGLFSIRLDGIHKEDSNTIRLLTSLSLSIIEETEFSVDVRPISVDDVRSYENIIARLTNFQAAEIERVLKKTVAESTIREVRLHKGDVIILAKISPYYGFRPIVNFALVTIR